MDFFNSVLIVTALSMVGCASLHHVQIGEIDNRQAHQVLVPFDIKVSETGVSTDDIYQLGRIATPRGSDELEAIRLLILLSQMGPQTGNPVYDAKYAEKIGERVYAECPSGRVTGLMSIRESRIYPVISGEIIKVTGYCAMDRAPGKSASYLVPTSATQTGDL